MSRGGELRVSDHALLRFLDRAAGLDVEALRTRIEASLARAHHAASSISDSDYLITADGLVFVVRRNDDGPVVSTVLPKIKGVTRAKALDRGTGK